MDIYKFRKKLSRYLKGRSNETENALIEAWYKSYVVKEKPLSIEQEFRLADSIRGNIRAAIKPTRVIPLSVFKIAASLLMIAAITVVIWKYTSSWRMPAITYYQVETGVKGIKQIRLADGSVIWLNSVTRIKVPSAFTGKMRTVTLEEGEAFFDINKDQQHPFIVKAGALNVQVLGTSFNIRAYKSLKSIHVGVSTGMVGVTKNGHTLAMLLPGQLLSYNTANGKYQQLTADGEKIHSWKTGYTYLTNADFDELALVVKNTFGLSLKANNSQIGAYHFTLRIQHNITEEQLLKLINQLHKTHFRKEGNDITLY